MIMLHPKLEEVIATKFARGTTVLLAAEGKNAISK